MVLVISPKVVVQDQAIRNIFALRNRDYAANPSAHLSISSRFPEAKLR